MEYWKPKLQGRAIGYEMYYDYSEALNRLFLIRYNHKPRRSREILSVKIRVDEEGMQFISSKVIVRPASARVTANDSCGFL